MASERTSERVASDRVAAALAAYWRHDFDENARILAELRADHAEGEALAYFQLMGLGLVALADRLFPERPRAEVIRYIGRMRQRYRLGPLEMDPRLAERVITDTWAGRNIMDAVAFGYTADDISMAVTVVMDSLLHEAGVMADDQTFRAFLAELQGQLDQRPVDLDRYPDLDEALRPYRRLPG